MRTRFLILLAGCCLAALIAYPTDASRKINPWTLRGVLALIVALSAGLYWGNIAHPTLFFDDFELVRDSLTWPSTFHNLLIPHNEHMSPVLRLVTFVFLKMAGLGHVALVCSLFSIGALCGNVALLFRLLRMEGLKEGPALAGAAVFGITSVYFEAVEWYSASYVSLAVLFILAGFLAINAAVAQKSWGLWVIVNILALLAESSFSSGILAGALFPIYAWLATSSEKTGRLNAVMRTLPGTMVYLALYLVFARPHMEHLTHYGGKSAFQALSIWPALANTSRALLDVTLLGNVGRLGHSIGAHLPDILAAALTLGLIGWAVIATLRGRRLTALALWFLTLNLILVYAFRNFFPYSETIFWGRYHIFSQIGLAILVAGGLDRIKPMQGIQGLRLAAAGGVFLFLLRIHDFAFSGRTPYIAPGQEAQLAVYERLLYQARAAGIKPDGFGKSLSFPIAGNLPVGFSLRDLYDVPSGASGDEIDLVAATEPILQGFTNTAFETNFPSLVAVADRRLADKFGAPAPGSALAVAKPIAVQGLANLDGQNWNFKITGSNACLTFAVQPAWHRHLFMNFRFTGGAAGPLIARLAWSYDGQFPENQQVEMVVNPADFEGVWDLDAIPDLDRTRVVALRFYPGAPDGVLKLDRFCCQ